VISELFSFERSFVRVEQIFGDCLQFQLEVSIWSLLFECVFTNCFLLYYEESTEEMAGDSQSSVKFMSHLLTKIYVVKFDGMNNFKM